MTTTPTTPETLCYIKWADIYKPVENTLHPAGRGSVSDLFETFGDDIEFIKSQDPNHVWTLCDGGEGSYITAGYHWVNRLNYLVTEAPWTDEWMSFSDECHAECGHAFTASCECEQCCAEGHCGCDDCDEPCDCEDNA